MRTAETFYLDVAERFIPSRADRIEGQPPAAWVAAIFKNVLDEGRATSAVVDDDDELIVVNVYFDNDRAVAECPFCPSAQIAAETDLRFFCHDCLNAEVGGLYVQTVWPS